MARVVRTKTRAEGGITEVETAQFAAHTRKWIARALSTDPVQAAPLTKAILGLYRAAGLADPVVVVVPSPLVMAFAYGASAHIYAARNATFDATDNATFDAARSATRNATDNAARNATFDATFDAARSAARNATFDATFDAARNATFDATFDAARSATRNATDNATFDATDNATFDATFDATDSATFDATDNATFDATFDASAHIYATDSATRNATDNATFDATRNATFDATFDATRNATFDATDSATFDATFDATDNATDNATRKLGSGAAVACYELGGPPALCLATRWWEAYQGGNMWAAYDCFLTGVRDVLGVELPEHAAYAHWEQAAIHGGFRVMHEKFCIVSDRPEILKLDENNLPHCETGPSHKWRDGWALYHWHGVAVPAHWIEGNPTPKEVLTEANVEVRAAGIDIIGWANMLGELGATLVDSDPDPLIGELYSVALPGLDGQHLIVKYTCPRNGVMGQPVPNTSHLNGETISTILGAKAWLAEMTLEEYMPPEIRT